MRRWLAMLTCRGVTDIHTNSVVVTLATPDFSMPYIVCALSSSLLAIYAGLMITTITARPRWIAARALSKAGRRAKLLKLVSVAGIFVVLVPYLDPEWRDWLDAHLQQLGAKL